MTGRDTARTRKKVLPMPTSVRNTPIGRKGGKARSEQKSLAARQNVRLRWHGKWEDGVIPVAALIDGAWYRGKGRTASVAVWDAHSGTFHTVGMNAFERKEERLHEPLPCSSVPNFYGHYSGTGAVPKVPQRRT